MDFLTPQFFDLLIVVVIIIGLALAAVRLYADFTRPLPPPRPPLQEPERGDDDTQPTSPPAEPR
ncbi:MAG: hypothetical protein ACUVSX_02650 [Aggregatilineales bacterium]